MNKPILFNLSLGVGFVLLLLSGSVFTVSQTKKALVFQFGEVVVTHETPGLKFKIPFIQNVAYFDRRLLHYNLPVIEVTAEDQKRIVVDLYVRYSISDLLLFYKTVYDIEGAQNRLATIVPASMRRVIGRVPLSQILSPDRAKIMQEIRREVYESARSFGVKVEDVRIIRADLPSTNSQAILRRMESERKQEAMKHRSEGRQKARIIRAQADRERVGMLANAEAEAEMEKGKGDEDAARIYSEAFNQDKEFASFYRSMQAYLEAFSADDTTLILSPQENDFFNYLNNVK